MKLLKMTSMIKRKNRKVPFINIFPYKSIHYCVGRITEESPRKRPRLSGQDGVRANPNENFIISIEYGDPDQDGFQESLFKVKGKHPVQKVLAMACRTFHLEDEAIAKYESHITFYSWVVALTGTFAIVPIWC